MNRIPRLTPEEQADFDRRTAEGRELLARMHERVLRIEAAQAQAEERRRRWRRMLPFLRAT